MADDVPPLDPSRPQHLSVVASHLRLVAPATVAAPVPEPGSVAPADEGRSRAKGRKGRQGGRGLKPELDRDGPGSGPPDGPPPHPGEDDDAAPPPKMPDGCPVIPIGKLGDEHYYLDALYQLRILRDDKHSRSFLLGLIGTHTDFLYREYPRRKYDKDTGEWKTIGIRYELLEEALKRCTAAAGLCQIRDRVRGPGAWPDGKGGLVLHVGDAIRVEDAWQPPGLIGRMVYTAGPATLRPGSEAGTAAALELLASYEQWHWRRGGLDARLLLGWTVASMVGGALDWRPSVWVTGGKGTGKSHLLKVLTWLFGQALLTAADSSAAGVYQEQGCTSLPIAIEEVENGDGDGRRQQDIIKLARIAGSGGKLRRGGQDHKAVEFELRSCFLFNSIIVPAMGAADMSRLAFLELNTIPNGAEAPAIKPDRLVEIGRCLMARIVREWPRLADVIQVYRRALAAEGWDPRGCDQLGTLLGCADVVLSDGDAALADTAADLAAQVAAKSDGLNAPIPSDAETCVAWLGSQTLQTYRNGELLTVAEWVSRGCGKLDATADEANTALARAGMRVMALPAREDPRNSEFWLLVANQHAGLLRLFEDSQWRGRAGLLGPWAQALRRVPEARPAKKPIRIGSQLCRGTLIPAGAMVAPAKSESEEDV